MATCPACGTKSRETLGAITLEPTGRFVDRPDAHRPGPWQPDRWQLADRWRLSCRCGWSVEGYLDGDDFIGLPATQVFPAKDGQ